MKRTSTTITLLALLLLAAVSAQSQMQMPKPGPELKKLDYFAGTWTMDGDTKPGPMGPGGKFSGTDHNQWMDGGYFLVLHSDFKSSMGSGTSTAYMGYNADEKVYTYDEFNTMGEAVHSKGTVDGDTWTWNSDDKMGGMTMKGRFTAKVVSATSYNFKFEMSQDGTNWTNVMDGKATKMK